MAPRMMRAASPTTDLGTMLRLRPVPPTRVLVVDGNGPLRSVLPALFHGFDVMAAADAIEAFAILGRYPRDVVLDGSFFIPTYDGLQLLACSTWRGPYPGVRRVLMSGLPESSFDEHVASRLVHRVLRKPLDRIAVETALRVEKGAAR